MNETEKKPAAPFHRGWWLLCTVGGAGHSPFASGTVGGGVAMLVYLALGYALTLCCEINTIAWSLFGLALCVVLFVAGVAGGNWAERYYQRKDDGRVVIDEVVGFWMCTLFLPFGWPTALLAFFVSRVVDIVKPPPAGGLQRLPGGMGIMIDDVVASIYGLIALHVLFWLFPWG